MRLGFFNSQEQETVLGVFRQYESVNEELS